MYTETNNFDIYIGPRRGNEYAVRVIDSPAGQSQNPVYQTLPFADISELLLHVQNLVAELEDMKELGDQLFRFLFPEPVKELFDRCQSKGDESLLRIRLRWDSLDVMTDLGRLPWEYICDQHDFLAQKRTLSLTRFLHDKAPSSLQVPDTLKILVTSAAPNNMPAISTDEELQHLTIALSEAVKQGKIELKVVKNATRRTLRQAIVHFKPHVLHFAGHGHRSKNSVGLILCDSVGAADLIEAKDLRVLLNNGPVRLAILNGCETAAQPSDKTNPNAAIQSMAAQLMGAGLPAVIGMQYALPDHIAITFMQEIYRGILSNEPLDQTMTEARIALDFEHKDKNFWALPTLYLRVHNGYIFNQATLQPDKLIKTVSSEITGLVQLIENNPPLRKAVAFFQRDIEHVHNRILQFDFYKTLHDKIQDLDSIYALVMNDFERLPYEEDVWDYLEGNADLLHVQLLSLLKHLEHPPPEFRMQWLLEGLKTGSNGVRDGIKAKNIEILHSGLIYIARIMSRGLPYINRILVFNSKELSLSKLIDALLLIHEKALEQLNVKEEEVSQFSKDISTLEQLSNELNRQVSRHDQWQSFDDELRFVEENFNTEGFIVVHWPMLQTKAEATFEQEQNLQIDPLAETWKQIERLVNIEPASNLIIKFNRCRRLVLIYFRKVDDELLKLCQELRVMNGPIDKLLRLISA